MAQQDGAQVALTGVNKSFGKTPSKRGIAMVFQSYALYPHMTVFHNMAFSLTLQGVAKAEINERVEAAAKTLQMEHLLDRRPAALSGGQRQRVAIGRAIVRNPDVFLFDEPLSNLDAALRHETRVEIAKLHTQLGATTIYVTHDQVEAMTLADKIVVLKDGCVMQVGSPMELFNNPANAFVAGFLGSPKMNFFEGTLGAVSQDKTMAGFAGREFETGANIPLVSKDKNAGDPVVLGIRPQHLTVAQDGPITGQVTLVERLGTETVVERSVSKASLRPLTPPQSSPRNRNERLIPSDDGFADLADLYLVPSKVRYIRCPTWRSLPPSINH